MRKLKLKCFKLFNKNLSQFLQLLNTSEGFTLIEVLVAIAILSFISLATYQMIDTNTNTKEMVIREDEEIVSTLAAIARIDSDFSQIYTPLFYESKELPSSKAGNGSPYSEDLYSNPNGSFLGRTKNGLVIPQFFSDDKTTVVFFTSASRRKFVNSKESRYAWVRYSLRATESDPADDPDSKQKGLNELIRQVYTADIYHANIDWSNLPSQVLMKNIKKLEFQFWDERAKKFTASLHDLNENKFIMRALKLGLSWVNRDGNDQEVSRIFRSLYPYFNTKKDDLLAAPVGSSLDAPVDLGGGPGGFNGDEGDKN